MLGEFARHRGRFCPPVCQHMHIAQEACTKSCRTSKDDDWTPKRHSMRSKQQSKLEWSLTNNNIKITLPSTRVSNKQERIQDLEAESIWAHKYPFVCFYDKCSFTGVNSTQIVQMDKFRSVIHHAMCMWWNAAVFCVTVRWHSFGSTTRWASQGECVAHPSDPPFLSHHKTVMRGSSARVSNRQLKNDIFQLRFGRGLMASSSVFFVQRLELLCLILPGWCTFDDSK